MTKGGKLEAVAKRIVGNGFVKVLRDMLPDVESDDIEQAVAGALRKPDQRPGERIDFFDGEVVFDGQTLHGGAEESADSVGDEVRRVLAGNDAFAQMEVAEIGDECEDVRARVRPGNDFDQMQIARRIEKVCAEEVLAKFGGIAFGDLRQRNAAGVGGDDGAGRAMRDRPCRRARV